MPALAAAASHAEIGRYQNASVLNPASAILSFDEIITPRNAVCTIPMAVCATTGLGRLHEIHAVFLCSREAAGWNERTGGGRLRELASAFLFVRGLTRSGRAGRAGGAGQAGRAGPVGPGQPGARDTMGLRVRFRVPCLDGSQPVHTRGLSYLTRDSRFFMILGL